MKKIIYFRLFQHAPFDGVVEINSMRLAVEHIQESGGEWKVLYIIIQPLTYRGFIRRRGIFSEITLNINLIPWAFPFTTGEPGIRGMIYMDLNY